MKQRSSNEKVTIYLAIFFILFLAVILVLYFLGIIGGDKPTVDIVLNKDVIVKYEKDKWVEVKSKDYSNYNWKKFKVYEEGQKKGTYSLFISEKDFYLFKEENNKRTSIDALDGSLYLGGKKDSKFIQFNKEDLADDDITYITSVLKKNKISDNDLNNYILGYKVVEDFDDDNKKEVMYVISNVFNDDVKNNAYSLVFIKDGNKTNYIYKSIGNAENRLEQCRVDLLGLIQVEKDEKTKIFTKCSYYSYSHDTEYGIYQNRYNNYELLLYIK